MPEISRRLTTVLAADVAGYSRLVGADEEGTVSRLRALRQELIDPVIAANGGRIVKTTGDGILIEFGSVVDALRGAIDVQSKMAVRNIDVVPQKRIEFRVGINVGDVIVESNSDLMGDGVNIAARLEGIAEAGGICLSEDAYRQVRDKIACEFIDLGEQQLKNIVRPVRVYMVRFDSPAGSPKSARPLPLPDKPSIAVLPFQNMSGDPEQQYFADGIVEDIITALSNFKSLFVIARNSSFAFKGKAIDVKQVGLDLGVRYVLEGSVRKAGGRVRITGQLIEASTGAHLWADKMDGELREVFDLQDQITARVVSSITPTIERAEIERIKTRPTTTTTSYDAYLRGRALVYQRKYAEARSMFKKATEQDPEYAAAYAASAFTYSSEQAVKGIIPTPEMRADALRDADTALAITNEDALVLALCAHPMAYICQQFDRGAWLADRAVALNPNLSTGWLGRGWISLMLGKAERGIESFETLLRLSPLDSTRPFSLSGIAFGHFFLNRYDEGRRVAKEILQVFPHHQSFATYIINCVGAGDLAEAKSTAMQFLKYDPAFRVSRAFDIFPILSPQLREKFDSALRSAGVPE
jgi:TolB-like protein